MSGLCTIADVRTIRGADSYNDDTTLDDIFAVYIQATTAYFEKFCKRGLVRNVYTEYFDGNNEEWKYLSEPNRDVPIDLTESFTLHSRASMPVVETLIAATAYEVFDDGLIRYPTGFECGKRNYKAIYTYGFDCSGWQVHQIGTSDTFAVPYDLRKSCAMQTCINLKKASGKLGDARLGLLTKGSIETEGIAQYITGIEPEVASMLMQYVKVQL